MIRIKVATAMRGAICIAGVSRPRPFVPEVMLASRCWQAPQRSSLYDVVHMDREKLAQR